MLRPAQPIASAHALKASGTTGRTTVLASLPGRHGPVLRPLKARQRKGARVAVSTQQGAPGLAQSQKGVQGFQSSQGPLLDCDPHRCSGRQFPQALGTVKGTPKDCTPPPLRAPGLEFG
uniref:Uncharacterized protein n=1 Tax=Eutreptiella gymnastica TaxID=73025 RepID=A0A7S1IRB7_9EUGL